MYASASRSRRGGGKAQCWLTWPYYSPRSILETYQCLPRTHGRCFYLDCLGYCHQEFSLFTSHIHAGSGDNGYVRFAIFLHLKRAECPVYSVPVYRGSPFFFCLFSFAEHILILSGLFLDAPRHERRAELNRAGQQVNGWPEFFDAPDSQQGRLATPA